MTLQPVPITHVYPITDAVIERFFAIFLCDDSGGKTHPGIVAYQDFKPDSFTVFERIHTPDFLAPHERNFEQYLCTQITQQLTHLQKTKQVTFETDLGRIVDACIEQVSFFLESPWQPTKSLFNQEFPWVLNRLLAFCLFGDPTIRLRKHPAFRTLTFTAMPAFLAHYQQELEALPLKQVLCYAIGTGLVGFDMKGRGTVRQDIVAFQPLQHASPAHMAQAIWDGLQPIVQTELALDDWELFAHDILAQPCKLLWFVDDLAETFLDVFLMLRLLQANPTLSISVVAKDGHYDNDAAIDDLYRILEQPLFLPLKQIAHLGRWTIVPTGPHMATANLRKLDPRICTYIEHADVLLIKGSGIHELFQGGINKPCYTAYILAREFNASETGFCEEHGPMLFFKTQPGEYAFWGFKGRAKRKQRCSHEQDFPVCWSTVQEHRRRQVLTSTNDIVLEIDHLLRLARQISMNDYWYPWQQEVRALTARLKASQR